jgi:hypothetical protein
MPTLEQALSASRSGLTPISQQPENKPPAEDQRVNSLLKSPYARCPLPPSNNSADSLRQWGQGNQVPKFRTQTPPSNVSGSSGSTTINVGEVNSSSSTTTGGGTTLPQVQNAAVTTTALSPGQTWQGAIQLAKAFILQSVSTSTLARVELYGTQAGQILDISRPVTQSPPSTTISLIMDVVLQQALQWDVLNCVGSNGNEPPSSTIYITVTNFSAAVAAITASVQFVPEQS